MQPSPPPPRGTRRRRQVLLNTTAKDDSDPGNVLVSPDAWQFTTGTAFDLTPPTIWSAAADPASAVAGVPLTIQANVMDDIVVASVSVHVVGPATDVNLTMTNAGGSVWSVTQAYSVPGTHAFTVWAFDGSGNANSAGGAFSIESASPPTPSGVATAAGSGAPAVVVTWTAVTDPNVVGYHVYRGTQPGGPYTRLTSSPLSASGPLRYSDVMVTAGSTYYYVVTSIDAAGRESPFSAESSMTVPSAAPVLPGDTLLILGVAIGIGLVLVAATVFLRRRRPGKSAK
jgi:hypothetical protein